MCHMVGAGHGPFPRSTLPCSVRARGGAVVLESILAWVPERGTVRVLQEQGREEKDALHL